MTSEKNPLTKKPLSFGSSGLGSGGFGFAAKPKSENTETIAKKYPNQSLKFILDDLEKQAAEQTTEFRKRANIVHRRERQIYDSNDLVNHLQSQIDTFKKEIENLYKSIDETTTKQAAFIRKLEEDIENRKKDLQKENEEQNKPDSDAPKKGQNSQRYELYQLADEIGKDFDKLRKDLVDIRQRTNQELQSPNSGENSDETIEDLKQIANMHLNALRCIDHQTTNIFHSLDELLLQLDSF